MKAIRVHKPGGREALVYEDVPNLKAGPGQVLMRVEAAGVNFIDVYYRTGVYQTALPVTVGQEGAGTVIEAGEGVTDVKAGDRIAFYGGFGAYAEQAVVPADKVVPVPDGVSAKQAAAVLLQGMTAEYLTSSTYPLGPKDTCLIHAAAGGVGLLFCQVAKATGARVIGTTSTEEKARLAREAGADEVILYTQTDFEAEVKRLTGGRGVDVVYDSVGKTTFEKGLNCLRPRGYMVLFGQSSGVVDPVAPGTLQAKGSLFLTRPTLVHHTLTREELLGRAGRVFGWVARGALKVHIHAEYALRDAAQAHAALEGRGTVGKLILVP